MANLADPVKPYAAASRDVAGDGRLVGYSLFHISVNGLYHSTSTIVGL
jgi:hypothetical protein